jgi:hypothetical protein
MPQRVVGVVVEVAEGIAGVAGSLLDHMVLVGEVFAGEGEVDNVAAFFDRDGGEETAADGGGAYGVVEAMEEGCM